MTGCLDAWPVIEWLHGREPSWSRLDSLITERPLMSWVNLGEVVYYSRRVFGADHTAAILVELRSALTLDLATPERVLRAAALKADHGLGYADAFAVATALAHDAVLLTGDEDLLARAPCPVEDLRA